MERFDAAVVGAGQAPAAARSSRSATSCVRSSASARPRGGELARLRLTLPARYHRPDMSGWRSARGRPGRELESASGTELLDRDGGIDIGAARKEAAAGARGGGRSTTTWLSVEGGLGKRWPALEPPSGACCSRLMPACARRNPSRSRPRSVSARDAGRGDPRESRGGTIIVDRRGGRNPTSEGDAARGRRGGRGGGGTDLLDVRASASR